MTIYEVGSTTKKWAWVLVFEMVITPMHLPLVTLACARGIGAFLFYARSHGPYAQRPIWLGG